MFADLGFYGRFTLSRLNLEHIYLSYTKLINCVAAYHICNKIFQLVSVGYNRIRKASIAIATYMRLYPTIIKDKGQSVITTIDNDSLFEKAIHWRHREHGTGKLLPLFKMQICILDRWKSHTNHSRSQKSILELPIISRIKW